MFIFRKISFESYNNRQHFYEAFPKIRHRCYFTKVDILYVHKFPEILHITTKKKKTEIWNKFEKIVYCQYVIKL